VVEIIGIAGACIVVCLGELTRRTVLGRHFEHELAESRSIPNWRLLRSEAELREALSRALESERTTLEQHARLSERYQGMYDAQLAGGPAEPRENARAMDVSVRYQTMGGARDGRAVTIPRADIQSSNHASPSSHSSYPAGATTVSEPAGRDQLGIAVWGHPSETVVIGDELDPSTAPVLRECVSNLAGSTPGIIHIVVDLADLAFVSSRGLHVLACSCHRATSAEGSLVLSNATDLAAKPLHIMCQ
jgi:anti-anti-sigma factor